MQQLTVSNCEDVSGGILPAMVIGVFGIATLLGNSGSIYDFISGTLDGYGGIN